MTWLTILFFTTSNDFSFFVVVVSVVRLISTTGDRSLRNITVTSVVVTRIVSSMISLVGIEPIAGMVVLVSISISSSNCWETKSKMLGLEINIKTPVARESFNYLDIILVVLDVVGSGGVSQGDCHQTQGEDEKLHCSSCCGRHDAILHYHQPFIRQFLSFTDKQTAEVRSGVGSCIFIRVSPDGIKVIIKCSVDMDMTWIFISSKNECFI